MEWTDRGIVLSARKHGEGGVVVSMLTAEHGRHAGLARGGASKRQRGLFMPGNEVTARWYARLDEHLGVFECELVASRAARVMDDPARLAALASACALIEAGLPERHPYPALHAALIDLLDRLESGASTWPEAYVRFEVMLLTELGFGLDLSACAVSGATANLEFVSPRSGRAVTAESAGLYRDRLFKLPRFLTAAAEASSADVRDGLALTGHFLTNHLFASAGGRLPPARERLLDRLADPRGLD
ncbi:MAG: DNA repair protein RecO [Alphaproteobacteria bacterium]|nr:DNA repair protein RecO [Alphaproteobacteria bacterium]